MKNRKHIIILLLVVYIYNLFSLKGYSLSKIDRIAGNDRFKTAVEISKAGWSSSKAVIIATGENYPDALCAAPLAKLMDVPILLTGKSVLNTDTENEINRLGVKAAFVLGGPGAISDDIVNYLKSKQIQVLRFWGSDRYETAVKVAKIYNPLTPPKELIVVSGEDFPDALSVSSIAAQKSIPIILVPKDTVPKCVSDYLKTLSITKTYVIGGTDVISNEVFNLLPNAERILGSDKYERNIAILNKFASDIRLDTLYVATGTDYPDALAGSVLAPKTLSPILLTEKIPVKATKDYINSKLSSIGQLRGLGGEGVIPLSTMQALLNGDSSIANIKVHYIDVGQADSILVQTSGGSNMLIDTGKSSDSSMVISYLKNQGVTKVDVLVSTNPNEEHVGGIKAVIDAFEIGKTLISPVLRPNSSYINLVNTISNKKIKSIYHGVGTEFSIGNANCTVLAPKWQSYPDTGNLSIVLKMTYGSNKFIFQGDALEVSEYEIMSKGFDISADVIKIGDHGSDKASSQTYLNIVNPKYAIITAGKNDNYGYPAKSTIDRLKDKGVKIYRTDEKGTIVVTSDGTNITFNCK